MHAGDAIWYLHAGLRIIERRHASEPATLALINHLRTSVKAVGDHCGVPEPCEADYVRLSDALERQAADPGDPATDGAAEYASDRPPAPRLRGSSYGEPELVGAGRRLVDEMVSSGHFDWADIVTSIQCQLESDSPFITPRQFRALINIAARGEVADGSGWWEAFEEDYPEAARVASEQAHLA